MRAGPRRGGGGPPRTTWGARARPSSRSRPGTDRRRRRGRARGVRGSAPVRGRRARCGSRARRGDPQRAPARRCAPRRRRPLALLLLVFAAPLATAQGDAGPVDLPVTRVVLFTTGVGYFEHAGTVVGDQEVVLRVAT